MRMCVAHVGLCTWASCWVGLGCALVMRVGGVLWGMAGIVAPEWRIILWCIAWSTLQIHIIIPKIKYIYNTGLFRNSQNNSKL